MSIRESNRKIFDARVAEVDGHQKLIEGIDPLTVLGLPVLQDDGTVKWMMPTDEEKTQ